MKLALVASFYFVSLAVHAAGGGHAASDVPTVVFYQALNFFIYLALLVFLLRKPVANYFRDRRTGYNQALAKARESRDRAEEKKREIETRLAHLKETSDESIAQAKAEAETLRKKTIEEATRLAQTLREESARTAYFEVERAKLQLREEMLNQSMSLSRRYLVEKMAEPDQKRLQTEFVDKIQVVR